MTASNRSNQFAQVHKVLKKHYTPVISNAERPVIEHLFFACCLEDARYDVAEEAFASIVEDFFDWNEVRVSTIRELSEVMARLPDPPAAATRLKRALQHVFEDNYTFDLEGLRKKNLGPAEEELCKIDGISRFTVSYVVQSALGGHSIPIDAGAIRVLDVLGLLSDKDIEAGVAPGLERAIAKSKGIEFGSLLHQFGADMIDNPFAAPLREILLEIEPACKNRLPKRPGRKKPTEPEVVKAAKPEETAQKSTAKGAKKKAAAEPKAVVETKNVVEPKATVESKAVVEPKEKKPPAAKDKKIEPPKKKPAATKKAPKKKIVVTKKKPEDPKVAAKTPKKKAALGNSKPKPR